MSWNRHNLPARARYLMAAALCVLAIAFALEAKTAWYGPAAGPGSAVRSAKALPMDTPRVVQHGIPVPDPLHPQFAVAFLTLLFAVPVLAESLSGHAAAFDRICVSTAGFFSPPTFFRPPPAPFRAH